MVRFIILNVTKNAQGVVNLHSNMVRFIIIRNTWEGPRTYEFTFQYG